MSMIYRPVNIELRLTVDEARTLAKRQPAGSALEVALNEAVFTHEGTGGSARALVEGLDWKPEAEEPVAERDPFSRIRIKYVDRLGKQCRATIRPIKSFQHSQHPNLCRICGDKIMAGTSGWRDENTGGYHLGCVEENAKVIPLAGKANV